MADCENGDRSMLLTADWFVCQGQDMAKESLGSIGLYDEWKSLQDATISTYVVRSITDSDGISGKNLRLYQLIMFGTAIVFSINFFVAIILFIILKVLSSKYK